MNGHDLKSLEHRINETRRSVADFAAGSDFEELLIIIRRPGWTSVAESLMVSGIVEAIHANVKALAELKSVLVSGAQKVGTQTVRG